MSVYRVTFADGDHLTTGFNGTIEDARSYYVGQQFNLGRGGLDYLVEAVAVEQIKQEGE